LRALGGRGGLEAESAVLLAAPMPLLLLPPAEMCSMAAAGLLGTAASSGTGHSKLLVQPLLRQPLPALLPPVLRPDVTRCCCCCWLMAARTASLVLLLLLLLLPLWLMLPGAMRAPLEGLSTARCCGHTASTCCEVCAAAELPAGRQRRLLPLLLAAVRCRCSVGQQQSVNARLATEAAGDPGWHASPSGPLTSCTPATAAASAAASSDPASAAPAASILCCQSRPAPEHHLPAVAARACCCADRRMVLLLASALVRLLPALPPPPLLLPCGSSGGCASILLGRKDLSQADSVWMEAPEAEVGEAEGLGVCCCCSCCCWR
jgi:hypothetical protein